MKTICTLLLLIIAAQAQLPQIVDVTPVDRKMLCLHIQQGEFVPSQQVDYIAMPLDSIFHDIDDKGILHGVSVYRDKEFIGYLAGKERNILTTPQFVKGDTLDNEQLDNRKNYKIKLNRRARLPRKIYRKSKPIKWSQPERQFVMQHQIYLQLGFKLSKGMKIDIQLENINLQQSHIQYTHQPEINVNQAIHVTQTGFHPNDLVKRAFLSVWLGNGGAHKFSSKLNFFLIDQKTQLKVHSGQILPVLMDDEKEQLKRECNLARTNIYRMDFSGFNTPGEYRIYIEGIGCSLPFTISESAWRNTFQVNMNGFYNIRSGIKLGPPYSDFQRERCYHPDDGFTMFQSNTPLMNTGNGLNALGTDIGNFGNLLSGRTDKTLPVVPGGYQDAGDWDRRIQHLDCSYAHLELYEMYPDYFQQLTLDIPENDNALPDIIDEAIYNIDFYRRLQDIDGGVRGGIETAAHPVHGETSYQESLDILVYAPGIWSSYSYAACAARLAFVLEKNNKILSDVYTESAIRAMRWAEQRYDDWLSNSDVIRGKKQVINKRNLAALELYRLTRETRWHEIFQQDTQLKLDFEEIVKKPLQTSAIFLYARLEKKYADHYEQEKAVKTIIHYADISLAYAERNAFGLTAEFEGIPMFMGYFSAPQSMMMCRAFFLTGYEKYLRGIILSTQFACGANPMNMTLTTGLGHHFPESPLHKDSEHTGQKSPKGITVYGPFDIETLAKENYWGWPIRWYLDKQCVPSAYQWPAFEGYFDIGTWPAVCEWTPQQTMVDASYVWGFLAAQY